MTDLEAENVHLRERVASYEVDDPNLWERDYLLGLVEAERQRADRMAAFIRRWLSLDVSEDEATLLLSEHHAAREGSGERT